MRTGSARVLAAAAATILVLTAAACGGGGGKTTTSTASGGPSAAQWANGVCSSFTTWKKSLQGIATSVTSQPSKSQLRQAGRQIERATETLARSLKELGKPETAQGEAAKKSLDALATTLQNGMSQLEKTLNSSSSSPLAQISAITATLTAMANRLELAGGNLKNFAPSGELEQAFRQADACRQYVH